MAVEVGVTPTPLPVTIVPTAVVTEAPVPVVEKK